MLSYAFTGAFSSIVPLKYAYLYKLSGAFSSISNPAWDSPYTFNALLMINFPLPNKPSFTSTSFEVIDSVPPLNVNAPFIIPPIIEDSPEKISTPLLKLIVRSKLFPCNPI